MNTSLMYRLWRKVYWFFHFPQVDIGYTRWSYDSTCYKVRTGLDRINTEYTSEFIKLEKVYKYFNYAMPIQMTEDQVTVKDLLESGI